MKTTTQLHQEARDYYRLCAEARELGIDTSLDTNPKLDTTAALRGEVEAARLWDSERRDSPYSTVADVMDEFCDACQKDLGLGTCLDCYEVAGEIS